MTRSDWDLVSVQQNWAVTGFTNPEATRGNQITQLGAGQRVLPVATHLNYTVSPLYPPHTRF